MPRGAGPAWRPTRPIFSSSTSPPTTSIFGPATPWKRRSAEFDGTVLLVSHDRYFVNRVADHLLVIEPERIRVIEGNYDEYQKMLSGGEPNRQAAENAAPKKPTAPSSNRSPKAKAESKKPMKKRRFAFCKAAGYRERDFDSRNASPPTPVRVGRPRRSPRWPACAPDQGPN